MDFSLNEDQKILIDMIRNFSKQEIIPISYSCDEKHSIPKELFDKAHELGLINFTLPIEYGGGGMGPIESALITENLSYGCPSIAFSMIANALGCNPILQFASPDQKKFWFEQISEKKWFVSFCLTEPQAGSDISGMKTYYEKKNGKFYITGHKAWITNSNLADLFVVFAYPRGSQKLTEMSAFIVPGNTPGILRGKVENKIGLKASGTSGISFESVEVPEENLIDQEGSGFKIAMGALAKGRIGTAALATGIQQRCVDECIEYSKTRIIQNKPLGDNPVIRQYIAEMQMNAENSRMATWRAAWKLARGEDAYFESSIAKAFSTMHAEKTALQAVQILGAWGISMEYPIAKLVNDAKVLSIVEGTTEIQKNAIADVLYGKGKPLYYT